MPNSLNQKKVIRFVGPETWQNCFAKNVGPDLGPGCFRLFFNYQSYFKKKNNMYAGPTSVGRI